jgi:N-acetylmuramic acid 6-phosphate etherase
MIWKNGRKWHSGHIPDFDDSPCTGPENLLKIMRIACALYKPQEIFLPAQLASAGIISDQQLKGLVRLRIMEEGRTGIGLLGATALEAGETIAEGSRQITDYALLETERPYDPGLRLERGSASEIVEILWAAEEEAGEAIQAAFSQISSLATRLADAIADGGRIIYAGAGSSGRIAALDAVEIPCTYGLCKDRILTLIPGGISRAAIEMEEDSGEDESAVSEALLMNIGVKDVMIGISASGSARFVQSALALAKFRGAYTVMIQNDDPASTPPFCDKVIPLRSGPEVVAGSTRMKAGTSTKKVLNFLTTTAMIILGNVRGNHMINLECINQKLKSRAEAILAQLFDLSPEESKELLRSHNYQLKKACQAGPAGGKMDHDRDK